MFLGLGGLLLFAIGGWFSGRLGGRIAGSVQALPESAVAMESGSTVPLTDAGFREADEAGKAMSRTADLLRQRGKALEAAYAVLQEREAVLAQAQRIAHIGSWHWNASTGDTVCSEEIRRIFGRETIPALSEQADTLFPRDAWQRLNSAVRAAAATGTGCDLVLPALRADGTPIWQRGGPCRPGSGAAIRRSRSSVATPARRPTGAARRRQSDQPGSRRRIDRRHGPGGGGGRRRCAGRPDGARAQLRPHPDGRADAGDGRPGGNARSGPGSAAVYPSSP